MTWFEIEKIHKVRNFKKVKIMLKRTNGGQNELRCSPKSPKIAPFNIWKKVKKPHHKSHFLCVIMTNFIPPQQKRNLKPKTFISTRSKKGRKRKPSCLDFPKEVHFERSQIFINTCYKFEPWKQHSSTIGRFHLRSSKSWINQEALKIEF